VLCVCVCVCVCEGTCFFFTSISLGRLESIVSNFIRRVFTADSAAGLTRNIWTPNSRQKMQITVLITILFSFFIASAPLSKQRKRKISRYSNICSRDPKGPATQNAVCRSGLRSLSAAECYILSRLF